MSLIIFPEWTEVTLVLTPLLYFFPNMALNEPTPKVLLLVMYICLAMAAALWKYQSGLMGASSFDLEHLTKLAYYNIKI